MVKVVSLELNFLSISTFPLATFERHLRFVGFIDRNGKPADPRRILPRGLKGDQYQSESVDTSARK